MAAPRHENIRQHILEVTTGMLAHTSFDGISLAQIAAKANISKGTLYYHFKSRDELLLALAEFYLSQQQEELLTWLAEHRDHVTLHEMVDYVVRQDVLRAPMRVQLYTEAMQGNLAIRKLLCSFYTSFHDFLAVKLADHANGISADYLAWLILLSADGLYIQACIDNKSMDMNAFRSDTADTLKAFFRE